MKDATTTDRPTGFTFKDVPQSGSYGTPKGTPDVKAAGKVADQKSKTSDPSTGAAQNLGKMGDHDTVCGNSGKG